MTDAGEIVKMCRQRLKWSRHHLGKKAGVAMSTIINIENNMDCRLSTFEKLIEAMGYEIEILRKE